MRMMRSMSCMSVLAAALALVACGGGGGSSSPGNNNRGPVSSAPPASGTPTASVAASQASANQATQTTLTASGDVTAVGGLAGIPLGIQLASLPVGVAVPPTACPNGGTASVTYSMANQGTITAGDSFSETFTNCSYLAGSSVSGQITATFNSYVNASNFAFSLAATGLSSVINGVAYGPYTFSATYSLANGAYSFSYVSNNNTVVGQPVVFQKGGATTIVSGTIHVNAAGGGWYSIVYSNWAWNNATGVAISGSVVVTGSNGDTVAITALGGGQYSVVITVNGSASNYTVSI